MVETKERNPSYGCPRIALLVGNVLGKPIDDETVRRILAKHYRPTPGKGPSWLLPIGKSPNKLWSTDLFRLESVFLRWFWVMVVMDQFTRQIVGFSVHRGALNGAAICFMFNKIAYRKTWPKYLSTDHARSSSTGFGNLISKTITRSGKSNRSGIALGTILASNG